MALPASSSPQATLEAYLNDAMGVRFDALSRLATPLCELYGINLQASLAKPASARSAQELNVLLTVLDTTRLFWAYFSLDREEQDAHAAALKSCLVGASPDAEADASFQELMHLMRDRWSDLPAAMRAHAQDTAPSSLPSFATLLDEHTGSPPASTGPSGYGPDQLEKPEALALFAQPLIDDPMIHTDPDALERRMALASAYWDLAHAPASQRADRLQALLQRFADSAEERDQLKEQAHAMLDRFADLFPEQTA